MVSKNPIIKNESIQEISREEMKAELKPPNKLYRFKDEITNGNDLGNANSFNKKEGQLSNLSN